MKHYECKYYDKGRCMAQEDPYVNFLNDIEGVAEKYGYNIDMSCNYSDDNEYPRVEITFGHAIGTDSQNRRF